MAKRLANIGVRGRRKRMAFGLIAFFVSVAILFALIVTGVNRWVRLVTFIPFWVAGLGIFQARGWTCVAHAARGVCNMNGGEEPVEDPAEAAQLRRQAVEIYVWTTAVAIAATALGISLG
jgi:hypothetical protein